MSFFSHQTIVGHKHVQTKKKNIVQQSGTLTQKSSNIQVQFGNRKKTIISSIVSKVVALGCPSNFFKFVIVYINNAHPNYINVC